MLQVRFFKLGGLALSIHEFQYNGLDPEGIVSKYVNIYDAERYKAPSREGY